MAIRVSDKLQLISSSFASQALRICTTLVMARFISPSDTGVYGLVVIVAGFVMSLQDFAIPASVVQIRDFSEETVFDTAIVLSALLYTFYGMVTVGGGIVLAYRYDDPRFWKLGILVAIVGMLSGLYNVQLARLNRQLRFRDESRQNFIYSIATAATGMSFAWLGWGVYAIALQTLMGQFVANIAIIRRVPLTWPRAATWEASKRIITMGAPVSAASYVSSIEGNIVGFVINSMGGQYWLGLWIKVTQVQGLFSQNLMSAFGRVAYPLLCHSTSNPPRMRMMFQRIIVTLMMAGFFFAAVMAVNSVWVIRLLGPKWWDALPLLQITSWAIPAGAIACAGYFLCMAEGQSKSILQISILNLIVFVPLMFLAKRWGHTLASHLAGLAICWSATRYLIGLSMVYTGTRRIGTGFMAVWRETASFVAAALASAGAMMLLYPHLFTSHLFPLSLIISGTVGAIVYGAVVLLLQREAVSFAIIMARGRTPGEKGLEAEPVDGAAVATEQLQALAGAPTASPDAAQIFLNNASVQPRESVLPPEPESRQTP